jgi:hypothetical protein
MKTSSSPRLRLMQAVCGYVVCVYRDLERGTASFEIRSGDRVLYAEEGIEFQVGRLSRPPHLDGWYLAIWERTGEGFLRHTFALEPEFHRIGTRVFPPSPLREKLWQNPV